MPVYEGYAFSHAVHRSHIAGREITENLTRILTERGYVFNTTAEREIMKDIKEKFSFVSLDPAKDLKNSTSTIEKTYSLPDGNSISVGNERFRCVEPLFQPSLLGLETPGIHELVYTAIQKCDIDARRDLYSNLVISGMLL